MIAITQAFPLKHESSQLRGRSANVSHDWHTGVREDIGDRSKRMAVKLSVSFLTRYVSTRLLGRTNVKNYKSDVREVDEQEKRVTQCTIVSSDKGVRVSIL